MPSRDYQSAKPEVSVLLPTFRRAKSGLFEKAVQSVLHQSFESLELIIIDDASTDGTADLIARFMKEDARVSCIRHQYNIGLPAISEYEGYMRARGEYIAFIFDDNEWEPRALEETISLMKERQIRACYGYGRLFFMENDKYNYVELGRNSNEAISKLYFNNFILNAAVVLGRDVIESVGLYDPHVSLTRLCDWDLWRRISQKYTFFSSGIFFTSEKGVSLSDSLGNSLKMDWWVSEERMQLYRDDRLLPGVFENIDIFDDFGARTQFFRVSMQKYAEQYLEKHWYRENVRDTLSFVKNNDNDNRRGPKRILVLATDITASVTLYFCRIFQDAGHIIRFGCPTSFLPCELALVDVLIVVRDIKPAEEFVRLAKCAGIKCYYFIDDNFVELSKDFPEDFGIKVQADLTTKEYLEPFSGVIASSPELRDYFLRENLHENVILLEPSINPFAVREPRGRDSAVLTVAFIGGAFRNDPLSSCVLPALQRLSRNVRLRFCCPEDSADLIREFESPALKIIGIPRNFSLDATLNSYSKYEVDIQIHCGIETNNNIYKTKNALINAVQLGAVLIASAFEPYTAYSGDEQCYFVAENTEEDWHSALSELALDAQKRESMYCKAREYCLNRYGGEHTVRELKAELERTDCIDWYHINKQHDILYLELYRASQMTNHVSTAAAPDISKPIESDCICISRPLRSKRMYSIICDAKNLKELGLIFTSFGTVSGVITLELYTKGYFLRKVSLRMESIIANSWTYFPLTAIYGCGGAELQVKLTCEYTKGSAQLLVYEDMRNRSLLYKIAEKFGAADGIGKNILYCDCRG